MATDLNLREDQVITKFNIAESSETEAAALELIEQGCDLIFATSFGHEQYLINVAKDHPDVEFCHATGYQAADSGLSNMHNFFSDFYQARNLSGIAAGLKTESNKLGYVAAQPFAECISGYSGFFLGAKSVNPDVVMEVKYTYSWNDEDIIAPGTVEAARDRIINTDWDVFTGPLKNNEGEIVVPEGETFTEPKFSPSWEHILEGIKITE